MTISMTIITIAGLSISRPLAIISMVSISAISVANMSIAISMTISISWLSGSCRLGISSRLSISRSLAIISMVTIAISMTIIAISRLGNSHTQEGKRNSNQKFHVV